MDHPLHVRFALVQVACLLAAALFPLGSNAADPAPAAGPVNGAITPGWTNAFPVPVEDAALIAFRRAEAEAHLLSQISQWEGGIGGGLPTKATTAALHDPDTPISNYVVTELMMMADYVATSGKIPQDVDANIAKFLRLYEKQLTEPPTILLNGLHYAMQARALALIEKVYPRRYPKTGKWLRAYWSLLTKGDTWDPGQGTNAADGLAAIYHIAVLMGWEKELANNPHLRSLAELYRDIVQPNGTVPTYGHGVTMYIYDYPFLLEAAGVVHQDTSFQYVADKVTLFHRNTDDSHAQFYNPEYNRHLPRALLVKMKPVPPKRRSFLFEVPETLGNQGAEADTGRPSKLVLRTGHHPLSAYLFMDMAAGYGAFIDQRQSIDGFGAQGITHWAGNDRRFLGQETIGLIAGKSKKVKFPYTRDQLAEAGYAAYEWVGPEEKDIAAVWRMFSSDDKKPDLVIGKIDIDDRPFETSARIEFKAHGPGRGNARKHILLTTEGILVIRDDYTAGSGLTGGVAGPIWYQHPTSQTISRTGADWILQPTLKHRATLPGKQTYQHALLVKQGLAPGQKVMRGINYSVAAQPIRRSGEKMTFLTIAMPVDPKGNPEAMAKSVQTIVKPNGLTALRIRRGEKHTMTITIDPRGNWKVNRSPGSIIRGTPVKIPKAGAPALAAVPGKAGAPNPAANPAADAAAAGPIPKGAVAGLDGKPLVIPEKMTAALDQQMLEWISDYKEDLAQKPLMLKGARTQLVDVDLDAKTLKVRFGSRTGELPFDNISESDKGRIALEGAKMLEFNKEVNLLAGYYLIRGNKATQSLPYLAKASDVGKDLRTLLGIKDDGH